jgi:glycosyltransferase involved in cell wall biosynthesis
MKVSGFSYIRNGFTYGYPFLQSIQSVLPVCDEFIIAVGNSTDGTREAIVDLQSPKIKIVDTVWDENLREGGKIFAQQANIALDNISGDWGFHIQADELVHEKDLETIYKAMQSYQDKPEVEGLLFQFLNFFGSYQYIGNTRRWHRKEIRIVRKNINVRSFRDSQGFRKYPSMEAYKNGHKGIKLYVKELAVPIYHYSYVRPPQLMQKKTKYFHSFWHDDQWVEENVKAKEYDYYQVDDLKRFTGTHPKLMQEIVAAQNWEFDINKIKRNFTPRGKFLYLVEKYTGKRIGEYKNYKLI